MVSLWRHWTSRLPKWKHTSTLLRHSMSETVPGNPQHPKSQMWQEARAVPLFCLIVYRFAFPIDLLFPIWDESRQEVTCIHTLVWKKWENPKNTPICGNFLMSWPAPIPTLVLKIKRTPTILCKLKHYGSFRNIIQHERSHRNKPVHRFAK